MESDLIVFLTDFGDSEYVGIMKAVIHNVHKSANIVDLTHSIPPQSIREGAWVLLQGYRHFPMGTIFVCVVDPGVGTKRDAVLVETKNYSFIGPDNGLLYPAVYDDGVRHVSSIIIEEAASSTFHGRDVFAKAGALLATNQIQGLLGGFKSNLDVSLNFHQDGRSGEVVRIDRFGNIITNVPPIDKDEYRLETDDLEWDLTWYSTYAEAPEDELVLVTGSYETLEITVKNSSARDMVHLRIGERLSLE